MLKEFLRCLLKDYVKFFAFEVHSANSIKSLFRVLCFSSISRQF